MARFRPFLFLIGALALLSAGSAALAQSVERSVRYTVRAGDTLIGLSAKYLTNKDDFRTVQQLNRIADPYRVPIGSQLVIPERLLRIEPAYGVISSFRGDVAIDGKQATVGMRVAQGNRIETSANAFVTVGFNDGSAISLPSQSRIRVDRLRRILLTDSVDRAFRLQEGRARSTVTPIRNPNSSFQVTTPLSVSAVRGTDFNVGFDPKANQTQTEVIGGTVGVAPDEEKDEIGVPKGYGVIGTPEGIQPPVKLLPPPVLTSLARGAGDTIIITADPVEGARGYRTQLAADITFREILAEKQSDKPTVEFSGLGNVSFFVRMSAIAPSGLEGIPGTFSSGRNTTTPPPADQDQAPRDTGSSVQTSMTGNGRSQPALFGSSQTLR
ncbi:hypothetical protein ASE00_02275 [Sphingomonas sp. Root710]|uniref:FecR family protein n=1 Tax=Sphingomonas sp. Root710 TaxID=1736594 RepID=UPI0006FCB6C7|nr:FecR domain-containing protein [Sphingomonas sp. Root710]KRB85634.1 hypothetical protein ASE00_02275 [Sphingomonas sp. Root710]